MSIKKDISHEIPFSLYFYKSTYALRGSKQQHGRIATTRTPDARCGPTLTKVDKIVVSPPSPNGPTAHSFTAFVI